MSATPAAASCIPLVDLLPDPAASSAVVFVGTVVAAEEVETELLVESWYLGVSPRDRVVVVGGREPGAITSVDWVPVAGERFVVVAAPAPDGSLVTAACQQSEPFPDLLAELEARYGDPQAPPFPAAPSIAPSPEPSAPPSASSPVEAPEG